MDDFQIALLIIGDLELLRRKNALEIATLQAALAEKEKEAEDAGADS